MGVFRSYFSKDNCLIKNKYVNTGLNPVVEIFYGTLETTSSRYIFDFDISKLKERMDDFRIPTNGTLKHTLKMTNTLIYDKHLLGDIGSDFREHSSSFDLVLFKVPQFWDEGTGYDYAYNNTVIDINAKIYDTSSNWYQTTDITDWNEAGIYSGNTSDYYKEVTKIHFDLGDEDIEADITELINELVFSGRTDFFGLGLAYQTEYESMIMDKLYSIGFFGKDTNSFYEPFIETTWDTFIQDDRNEFIYDKINKLYLYTNLRKEPFNLDSLPTSVEIKDFNDTVVQVITGITHESKGVYSIELELNSIDYDGEIEINFTDTWKGLQINNKALKDKELNFTIKQDNYYNVGTEVYEPEDYGFSFYGIKSNEKIPRGEVRKVIIDVKKMYSYDNLVVDGLSYRIYIKQGRNQIDIINGCAVNKAYNQNYFYLDTGWLISQVYWLELTLDTNGTTIKKDEISFTVLDTYSGNINFNL